MIPMQLVMIPDLGAVELKIVSVGSTMEASRRAREADPSARAKIFVDTVVARVVAKPTFTSEELDQLPNMTRDALFLAVVDRWGIRDEYDQLQDASDIYDHIYRAYQEQMRRIIQDALISVMPRLDFGPVLQRLQEVIRQQVSVFSQQIAQIGQQLLQQNEPLQRTLDQFRETLRRSYAEINLASQMVSPSLRAAGFWFPLSAPFALLSALRELVDAGTATPQNVRQLFVSYYEDDDFFALRLLVDDWKDETYLASRMHIIEPALVAHIAAQYVLSVPALLALVEGVLTDLVGRRAEQRDGGLAGWAGTAIETMYDDVLRDASKDVLVEYVTGVTVYGRVPNAHFTPQNYNTWLMAQGHSGDQALQRHAILHGVQTDYGSKENSLRAFLLLDVLAHMARRQRSEP